ncbi:FAD-binding oxidoreductase [Comamonas sp. SCN 65-56]|uniref:FAD-binding oxidoreductase n=1 Tax=Comamonas sp. SCN 65-56 TaxID=1660095 RepID=UPI000A8054A4|nr:FAD-binding oxidoreductase [Comamonas sp. SCN 65-56]
MRVSSWGRLNAELHQALPLDGMSGGMLPRPEAGRSVLPYGMGRSYGDVCLNPGGALWLTPGMDHWLDFDASTGRLTCQAGALLADIQRLLAPRGWMLPVTPGTQYVTVGGAIANDVHGKNHHTTGSFGNHVCSLTLLRTDGCTIVCGPEQEAEWFHATVGGLGLTGLIARATLQLRPVAGPWMETETIAFDTLECFYALVAESEAEWEYTVSWIDCLSRRGRGLFMRANHCDAATRGAAQAPRRCSLSMPLTPPLSLVNAASLRGFNALYYHSHRARAGKAVSHYLPFFYPLDGIGHWNRMYGPRGFYQYQCVVPFQGGDRAIEAMLAQIAESGQGSFLAVLKTFGHRPSLGLLSFPQPGITLALDFPNQGDETLRLFGRLDAIVGAARGRIYPAKDARMPAPLFQSGYPQWEQFLPYRDPGISSAMSRRLMGS